MKYFAILFILAPLMALGQPGGIRPIQTNTQHLKIGNTLTFGNYTITGILGGTANNQYLVTKGYVDDLGLSGGGASDTIFTRLNARIYPTQTDDKFSLGSATDYGNYHLSVDGSTIFRLRNGASFRNLDFITASSATTPYWRISQDGNSGLMLSKYNGTSYDQFLRFPYDSYNLILSGAVILGNTTAESAGSIRYNGTSFQGYNGTSWITFGEGGTGSSPWTASTYGIDYTAGNVGIGATAAQSTRLTVQSDAAVNYTATVYNSNSNGLALRARSEAVSSTVPIFTVTRGTSTDIFRVNGAGNIRLANVSTTPPTPATGYGHIYAKYDGTADKLFFQNAAGTEYDLTAAGGSSPWTSDASGIYTTQNTGIGSLGAASSGITLDVYRTQTGGYSAAFTNPSTAGHGITAHIGSTNDSYNIAQFKSANEDRAHITAGGAIGIKERAAPGTPPANYGYLYSKTDSKLYFKNDNGTEYDLTASGSGMSNPMTSAGDLIYGQSGGTPARLGINNGKILASYNGLPYWGKIDSLLNISTGWFSGYLMPGNTLLTQDGNSTRKTDAQYIRLGDHHAVRVLSQATTLNLHDNIVIVPNNSYTVYFPGNLFTGKTYTIVNRSAGTLTVPTYAALTGSNSTSIGANSSIILVYSADNSTWYQIK